MEDMTDDDVVELGSFCEALRLHPSFNVLIKQFEMNIVEHMMSTAPHETKKRDGIYAQCTGFRDFLSHMDAIALQKHKILDAQKPAVSEDDPQAEEQID